MARRGYPLEFRRLLASHRRSAEPFTFFAESPEAQLLQ